METQGQQPSVTISIENRKATSEQKEAGKRLFSSLITRAQNTTKARAQAVAEAPPAVEDDKQ